MDRIRPLIWNVYFWPLSSLPKHQNLATGECLTQKVVSVTNPNPFYSMLQLVLKIQIGCRSGLLSYKDVRHGVGTACVHVLEERPPKYPFARTFWLGRGTLWIKSEAENSGKKKWQIYLEISAPKKINLLSTKGDDWDKKYAKFQPLPPGWGIRVKGYAHTPGTLV